MTRPFSSKPLPPLRIAWLGFFFLAGAALLILAGVSLIFPGTLLDRMWRLNPTAHAQLSVIGKPAGILLLLLSPLLAVTGAGVLACRRWSYYASLTLIGINILGDLVNVIRGDYLKGFAGIVLANLLFLYLLSPPIKTFFLPLPER